MRWNRRVPSAANLQQIVCLRVDVRQQPPDRPARTVEPAPPVRMRLNRVIFRRDRNQSRENRPPAGHCVRNSPINGQPMPRRETLRDFVTEIRRQPGSGDARNFRIFERLAIDVAQAIRERGQQAISKAQHLSAVRIARRNSTVSCNRISSAGSRIRERFNRSSSAAVRRAAPEPNSVFMDASSSSARIPPSLARDDTLEANHEKDE